MRSWFNVFYVLVLLAALAATAEWFRRRHGAPLKSAYTLVLYLTAIAFLPLVFLFGYAGGGSVGMGIAALAANALGLQAGKFLATGAAIAGIFIGSYLVGFIGVLAGVFFARLTARAK